MLYFWPWSFISTSFEGVSPVFLFFSPTPDGFGSSPILHSSRRGNSALQAGHKLEKIETITTSPS